MTLQILVNGVVAGLQIALLATAFSSVYRCARVFHLSLAGIYTVAPYLTWTLSRNLLPLWMSIVVSAIACATISLLIEVLNHRPLDNKGAGANLHLVSSLGIYLSLVSLAQLLWGFETRVLRTGNDGTVSFLGAVVTTAQWVSAAIGIVVFTILLALLRAGRAGLVLRAIASNSSQTALAGFHVSAVRGAVFAVSGALAGLAGNLSALDIGFGAAGGLEALLIGIAAAMVSGNSLLVGPYVASICLGVLRAGIVWMASSRWQEAITFAILAIALLLPRGASGKSARLEAQ